jgi:hypothetical protein
VQQTIALAGGAMSRREQSPHICAYCGREAPETSDHIPPKGMFSRPYPSDLLTVPCCEICQPGWSSDDEYFRTVVLSCDNLQADPRTERVTASVLRSLTKPSKKGFAKLVGDSLTIAELFTPSGLFVGKRPAIKVDSVRIEKVLIRVLRALFYYEFRVPVPADHRVSATFDQYGERVLTMLNKAAFPPARHAAGGMFRWTRITVSDQPWASLWIGSFYDKVFFAGIVGPASSLGWDRFAPSR